MLGVARKGAGQVFDALSRILALSIGTLVATGAYVLVMLTPILAPFMGYMIEKGVIDTLPFLPAGLYLLWESELLVYMLKTAAAVTLGALLIAVLILPMRGALSLLILILIGAVGGCLALEYVRHEWADRSIISSIPRGPAIRDGRYSLWEMTILGLIPGAFAGAVFAYFARREPVFSTD